MRSLLSHFLVAAAALCACRGTSAQVSSAALELFNPDPLALSVTPAPDRAVLRARSAVADRQTLAPLKVGDHARLNFFDDLRVEMVLDRREHPAYLPDSRDEIWIGHVDGVEGSTVEFTAHVEEIAGTIFLPPRTTISIESRARGVVVISELDPDVRWQCGTGAPTPHTHPDTPNSAGGPAARGPGGQTFVEVLAAYTPDVLVHYGHNSDSVVTAINSAIVQMNEDLDRSAISTIRVSAVGYVYESTYDEPGSLAQTLDEIKDDEDGRFDDLRGCIRERYGADVICVFTAKPDPAAAGIAFLPPVDGDDDLAFAVVSVLYPSQHVFAHEIGHVLGCGHDRATPLHNATLPCAHGHAFTAGGTGYVTVMAYTTPSNPNRVGYFSNPTVSFLGVPTGVGADCNSPNADRSVDSIIAMGPIVAAYRQSPPVYSNTQTFDKGAAHAVGTYAFAQQVAVQHGFMAASDAGASVNGRTIGGYSTFIFDPTRCEWRFNDHIDAGSDYTNMGSLDLATDGSRIVALAYAWNNSLVNYAVVHAYGAGGWQAEQVLPAGRAVSVSVEGDTIVLGDPYAGRVSIYRHQFGGAWTLETEILSPPFGPPTGTFGSQVDLRGSVLVVGAAAGTWYYGAIVYRRSPTGQWQYEQSLVGSESPGAGNGLGYSVSTDQWRVIIGRRGNPGGALVYKYDPSLPGPPWHFEARIDVPAGGSSVIPDNVSIHGGLLLVSDRWGGVSFQGRVHCYRFENNAWILEASLSQPDGPQANDQFGFGMGQYGTTVVVGGNPVNSSREIAAVFLRDAEVPNPPLPPAPTCPVILTQPLPVPGQPGAMLSMNVSATGSGILSYQWKRNNVPLVDGPIPGGGTISGATTPLLRIIPARPSDSGTYQCVITNTCGSVSTIPRYARIYCPTDFDRNGLIAIQDVFAFLNAWFAGCRAPGAVPCYQSADFNGSGALSVQDVFDFLNGWFAGCT